MTCRIGSSENDELKHGSTPFCDLPYRQLRNVAAFYGGGAPSDLPYRQLRKVLVSVGPGTHGDLPYRQLRKETWRFC